MKIRTNKLTDDALDYAVAVADGQQSPQRGIGGGCVVANRHTLHRFNPSTDWNRGGPIIERERITISTHERAGDIEAWRAMHMRSIATGPTPLIAAMRCYVTSKLGEVVEVPDEFAPAGEGGSHD